MVERGEQRGERDPGNRGMTVDGKAECEKDAGNDGADEREAGCSRPVGRCQRVTQGLNRSSF
jgi:hypothetical protein